MFQILRPLHDLVVSGGIRQLKMWTMNSLLYHTLKRVRNTKSRSLPTVSTHVIYVFKCPCGLIYEGQTKHNLKLCIAEQKAAIRNGNMPPPGWGRVPQGLVHE